MERRLSTIVAADVPGCRDIVKDGENGILVPVREVESLAIAIQKLLEDSALRQKMGMVGRKLVEERFSTQNVIEETMSVYAKALDMEIAVDE